MLRQNLRKTAEVELDDRNQVVTGRNFLPVYLPLDVLGHEVISNHLQAILRNHLSAVIKMVRQSMTSMNCTGFTAMTNKHARHHVAASQCWNRNSLLLITAQAMSSRARVRSSFDLM